MGELDFVFYFKTALVSFGSFAFYAPHRYIFLQEIMVKEMPKNRTVEDTICNFILPFIALPLLTPSFLFAQSALHARYPDSETRITVASSVSSVTVYSDRALVTRVGSLTIPVGSFSKIFRVEFASLPPELFDGSVSVRVLPSRQNESVNAVRISDVSVQRVFGDTVSNERVRQLRAKLADLEKSLRALSDADSVLMAEKQFVTQLRLQSSSEAGKDLRIERVPIERWKGVLKFIETELTRLNAAFAVNAEKEEVLKKAIQAIKDELAQLGSLLKRGSKRVEFVLEASQAGTYSFAVSYVVPSARWQPSYDIRVFSPTEATSSKNAGDTLLLAYRAVITQSTGEDWDNVEMTLSTAKPSLSPVMPELSPWYLDVAPPPAPARQKAMWLEKKAAEVEVTSEVAPVQIETHGTAVSYVLRQRVSVPSDNAPHRVAVADVRLPDSLEYAATPKLSERMYVRARVKNISPYLFLPGPLNVFFDNEFVTSTRLELMSPGEELLIPLGSDPRFQIKRQLLSKFTEESGVFTRNIRVTYEFEISVESFLPQPAMVKILDQVPVSRNEKISVELLEAYPQVAEQKPDGTLVWSLRLLPEGKQSVRVKFRVEYPSDIVVTGIE
ncbi:MAG: mucoidy inhibitor MuiA family protein [Bacteroidota bacterium]